MQGTPRGVALDEYGSPILSAGAGFAFALQFRMIPAFGLGDVWSREHHFADIPDAASPSDRKFAQSSVPICTKGIRAYTMGQQYST